MALIKSIEIYRHSGVGVARNLARHGGSVGGSYARRLRLLLAAIIRQRAPRAASM
jgi:hypothetical protein